LLLEDFDMPDSERSRLLESLLTSGDLVEADGVVRFRGPSLLCGTLPSESEVPATMGSSAEMTSEAVAVRTKTCDEVESST
jgi:hypothetical protein